MMEAPIMDFEATALLAAIKRRERAKAVLASRPSRLWMYIAIVASQFCISFFLSDWVAPLGVKAMVCVGFIGTVMFCFDYWQTQRRLEAAIELIRWSDDGRK